MMLASSLKSLFHYIRSCKGVWYSYKKDKAPVVAAIKKVRGERRMLLSLDEAYNVVMCVLRTAKVPGDIAEVGVYQGGSAKLIARFKKDKHLHLFDTFEGLPSLQEMDRTNFYEGQFPASYESVKKYLSGDEGISIYKGLFPETAQPIKEKRFSFLHLDVDIYESTLACLEFFYPRINRGGVILSHDYINSPGVRKAFDEFFQDKPEPVIELYRPRRLVDRSGSQCLAVKT